MKINKIKLKKLTIQERKDAPRIFFNIKSITKSEDNEGRRIVEGYLAKSGPDRTDIWFKSEAFDTAVDDLTTNSTVFLNHDWEREIGKVLSVRVDDSGIWVKCMISKSEDDIWTKLEEGVLNSFSVGFSILEYEKEYNEETEWFTYWVTKAEFYDTSIVGLPANAGAKVEDVYIEKSVDSLNGVMCSTDSEFKSQYTKNLKKEGSGGDTVKETIKQLLKSLNISVELAGQHINLEEEGAVAILEDIKSKKEADENFDTEAYLKNLDAPADEPKADEPKADEPKADEPKADEPKADEPKADEPKADEPKADEPKADEPKADEPKADEPKADEPKADEPKADEPKADEPAPAESEKSLEAVKAVNVQVKELSEKLDASTKALTEAAENITSLKAQVKSLEESQMTKDIAESIFADLLAELPDMDEIRKSVQNIKEVDLKKEFDNLSGKDKIRLILMKQLNKEQ